jgi:transcriptional regulator with XRE-family HTH domain
MPRPRNTGRADVLRTFGAAVRAVREERGLSQEKLAAAAGLDRTYVGGIERGERNPSTVNIVRIADALGVSPAVFFQDL